MPVMDGLEATTRLRELEQQVYNNTLRVSIVIIFTDILQQGCRPATIIGLSGNARDEYKEQALAAGMDHCIFWIRNSNAE